MNRKIDNRIGKSVTIFTLNMAAVGPKLLGKIQTSSKISGNLESSEIAIVITISDLGYDKNSNYLYIKK
jgi:hypothetical protein